MTHIYIKAATVLLTSVAAMFTAAAHAQTDNSVSMNTSRNQTRLTVNGTETKYYNTDEVSIAVDKTAGTVTVTPNSGTWKDVYTRSISNISFAKAVTTDGDGKIVNSGVEITEARGWQESAYVEWNLYDGAKSYNVYVKGGQYADYTKTDSELVRSYGTYGRADAVGLQAGTYSMKVVPVNEDGTENTAAASEATDMKVTNYSREGFAHFNFSNIGAYNDDGTLKDGAKVLYVTASTAKTISTQVKTSSKGSVTVTGLQAILDAYQKGYDTTPIAFRIIGKVTLSDLDDISSSSEGLQIKGNGSYSTMNLTLEGIGEDATVYGFGFLIRNTSSVEFRNFAIMRCLDDAMSLDTDNSHIWIHNMDFFYGKKGSAADQAKGDGTVDIKGDSQYITVAYNHFWDNGKSSMCGMTSESGENWITYQHNWFDHSDSRHPRIRTMSVHMWNNYFDHNDVYGVGATSGSSVFVENNYFRAVKRPVMSSKQGTDATGTGTFSGENGGLIKAYGNLFIEKPSSFSYITYAENNTSFDAYETATRDDKVPSDVITKAGGTQYNNFDTDASKIYAYNADAAADVPAVVTGYKGAGRLNHGDVQFAIPDEAVITNGHHQPLPALATLIDNYESALAGSFGDSSTTPGKGDGTGGDTGGETGGDDTPAIEGTVTCDFSNKAPSNSAFTVTGTYSTSKGSATVDGTTYTTCLKMESSTSIKFTTTQTMKMTLYFGSNDTKVSAKIDGQKVSESGAVADLTAKTLTHTLAAGSHELTKQDTCNLFYIKLEPVTE